VKTCWVQRETLCTCDLTKHVMSPSVITLAVKSMLIRRAPDQEA
jgi:hypothetical protein